MSGVMLGRAAYHEPMLLAEIDHRFFGEPATRSDLGDDHAGDGGLCRGRTGRGARGSTHITRHMLGLANGRPGARAFRQILSVDACRKRAQGPT